jgi:hypothetical protein
MSETPDTRIVISNCVAWSTKANGKPDGGADSTPVDVRKDTVVVVEGVGVEIEPRSLLVRATLGNVERRLEIREHFLAKPTT